MHPIGHINIVFHRMAQTYAPRSSRCCSHSQPRRSRRTAHLQAAHDGHTPGRTLQAHRQAKVQHGPRGRRHDGQREDLPVAAVDVQEARLAPWDVLSAEVVDAHGDLVQEQAVVVSMTVHGLGQPEVLARHGLPVRGWLWRRLGLLAGLALGLASLNLDLPRERTFCTSHAVTVSAASHDHRHKRSSVQAFKLGRAPCSLFTVPLGERIRGGQCFVLVHGRCWPRSCLRHTVTSLPSSQCGPRYLRPPCATARCLANFLQLFLCQSRAKRSQNKAMAGRELRGMFESRHSGSDGPKSGHGVVFMTHHRR